MDCSWIRARIPSHIDGELTGEESRQLDEHLQHCESCCSFASKDRELLQRLKTALSSEAAPREFAERLRSALAAEPLPAAEETAGSPEAEPARAVGRIETSAPRRRTAWGLLAAAAAALLITLAVPWGNDGSVMVSAMAAEHSRRLSGKPDYGRLSFVSDDAGKITGYLSKELGVKVALPASRTIPEKRGASMARCGGRKMGVVGCFCMNRGKAVTLFIVKAGGLNLTGLDTVSHDGREYFCGSAGRCRAVMWRRGNLFYALVGDLEADDILGMARSAACSLGGQTAPADARTSATYVPPGRKNPS